MVMQIKAQEQPLYRTLRSKRTWWGLSAITASIFLHLILTGAIVFVPGWFVSAVHQEEAVPVEIVMVEPEEEEKPEEQPEEESEPEDEKEKKEEEKQRFLDRANQYAENPQAANTEQVPDKPLEKPAEEPSGNVVLSEEGLARAEVEKKKQEAIIASTAIDDGNNVGGRLGALLRAQIGRCWDYEARAWMRVHDIEQLRVYVEAELYQDGTLKTAPKVFAKDGITTRNEVVADAVATRAEAAILRCAPYRFPQQIYDEWKALKLVFLLS